MLLTPVVSSTFASVNTLFKRFDLSTKDAVDSFGYLIIDEAGQAIPYSALGAILRAKKTIVVGDPLQIEPVVADDLKILKERVYKDPILARYTKQEENNQEWSVQSCADLINPYGIYNKGYGWIGSPLIVHRRCIDPMFTISNMLSYDGMMINPNSDEKSQDSRWIDVSEINMDPGYKHYNIAQEDALVKLVGSLVRELGPEPDIYIISPFKDIGEALTKRIRDGVVCKDSDAVPYLEKIIVENKADEKKKKRIGTVHTFQGKDSKIVILLLGCERKMHKSIEWVKKSILNVAMTRAEKRIYVIGDWEAWSKYNPSIRDNKELFSSLVKSS